MQTMKRLPLLLFFSTAALLGRAQLTAKSHCDVITVDILDGKVNGLKPNARFDDIKEKLPCFTATVAEGSTDKCGGSIAYKDKDIYFFTDRDYIEIREKFQGKFTTPILGVTRANLFKLLGNPKIKDDTWEAYQMAYGILVVHFDKATKVNRVQFSTRGTDTLSLCDM
ncbi:MAG TPA: hypothetical protein VL307_20985 [Chitinophagaceae bacterium]|nr:hypothetical protein [Chitinophagaceae bacterium]